MEEYDVQVAPPEAVAQTAPPESEQQEPDSTRQIDGRDYSWHPVLGWVEGSSGSVTIMALSYTLAMRLRKNCFTKTSNLYRKVLTYQICAYAVKLDCTVKSRHKITPQFKTICSFSLGERLSL